MADLFDLRELEGRTGGQDDLHQYLKQNTTDGTGSINDLTLKYIKEVSDDNTLGIGYGSYNDMVKQYSDAVG